MGSPRPLRGAPAAPATPFVGRRSDIASVRRHVEQSRVVTLTGPPGVGKTRLALRTAEELRPVFPDGVCVADLLALTDPALLTQEVAGVLGLEDATTSWGLATLAGHIRQRRMLVVLDNCEHLLDACAVLVDSFARTCPDLRILATSRQSLGIGAEVVYRVAPLPTPASDTPGGDAVELLLQRAAAIAAGFAPDESELRAVADLARRLEGIPLAIELAAGRLRTLTVEQILERLGNRLDMLAGRDATVPRHHRTLRATLDWSRDLASEEERLLWRRAAVFAASFDVDAAEAVCSGPGLRRSGVLKALDGLIDKSLLTAARTGTTMRYRMLDAVRDYGSEMLRDAGEEPELGARLATYYAGLCRRAWDGWAHASQPQWFDRLSHEHANLRAALDWASAHDVEVAAAMAADMWLYWEARAHLTEGRRRLGALLEVLPGSSPIRPKATWVAGYLALGQSDVDAARPLLLTAQELAGERGDDEAMAFATHYLGLAHLFSGDVTAAGTLFERALGLHRRLGSRTAPFALTDVAVTAMLAGDLQRAISQFEQALVMNADDGDPWTRSHAHWGLGVAAYLAGDLDRAEKGERTALDISRRLDERSGIALCLEAMAWIAAARGALERAATLQGSSEAIWQSIPGQLPRPMRVHADRCRDEVVARLGTRRWQRVHDRGRRLDRATAVAFALDEPPVGPPTAVQPGDTSGLSPRELQVAALIAEGLTDRQIATRLLISQRTAESHVQHIRTKLDFRSRTQIASWMARRTAP